MLTLDDVSRLRLLDNVSIPAGLKVNVTDDVGTFMALRTQLNSAQPQLFGTAYRQGTRLHFATAMSVRDYLNLVKVNQAPKGATLEETRPYWNRPKEAAHGKAISRYLDETACQGLPFIFPSFVLNYGLEWTEDLPQAELTIFCGSREALAWPAIFSPPASGGLPVTDGGHRTDEIDGKFEHHTAGRLAENAVSVLFVMESDVNAYHQDFADCAKAKTIAKSLSASWDLRDKHKKFAVDLVERSTQLRQFVDATSNSVNLPTNSKRTWSMSALNAALTEIVSMENDPARLSSYIDLLFTKIPILIDIANGGRPGEHRNVKRGGCVLLRGVGFAVLIEAYRYASLNGIDLARMADYLAAVDWHVLKPDAPAMAENEDAYAYTKHAAQPIWLNMLAMMAQDKNFRIKGTHDAAKKSFEAIRAQLSI